MTSQPLPTYFLSSAQLPAMYVLVGDKVTNSRSAVHLTGPRFFQKSQKSVQIRE